MIGRWLISAGLLGLSVGCASLNDLSGPESALSSEHKSVAVTISDYTARFCTRHQWRGTPDKKVSGDMKITAKPEVKRLYASGSGIWYKAEVAAQGVWDNIYYNRITDTIICGEESWKRQHESQIHHFHDVQATK